ncbi:hypothetical protein KY318_03785, partial [Candidatus Woesearchaeota archaeon]|nr:hypothetical protein [Candidatus Woesearchaeota archaeon]
LYDEEFELLKNVLVEINTHPKQTYVSKDGSYSFTLTAGRYNLRAFYRMPNGSTIYTSKEVLVSGGGEYKVDLILDKKYTGEVPEITKPLTEQIADILRDNFMVIVAIALGVLVLILLGIIIKRWRSPGLPEQFIDLPEDLRELLRVIKKAGGRIKQKDLRKQYPDMSEAKVSLMVSELEARGLLQKIKKGRGNIIVLKRVKG